MAAAALKAARGLIRDFGEVEQLQVSIKGPGDFVSAADLKAERTLKAELGRARPGYGMLFEEGGASEGSDKRHRWIVDPLDGTTNFLHGIPHFCISIGLERDGEIVAGGVYEPTRDRGDQPAYSAILASIMAATSGVRRFGAAALDLAYVAAGRLDGFWEFGLSPWDIAAGMLLVREAGGYVSDLSGGQTMMTSGDILAANDHLHLPLAALIREASRQRTVALGA